jgi:carboxylate-amine ligase
VKPLVSMQLGGNTPAALRHVFDIASTSLTLGVEEELMLIGRDGALASCVDTVLRRAAGDPRIVAELRACQLEIVTRPSPSAADLGRELATVRCAVDSILPDGVSTMAAGAHPAARPGPITDGERYLAIAADHPWAARHMLTCGLHVHIGVAGADRALAVYNALRSFLPELCALAANSPFHEGADAGVASVRTHLNRSVPRSGTPPAFESWDDLARYVEWGARGRTIPDASHQWWALRLHPGLGTLELRVFDTQTDIADTLALAAFSQALVAWLLDRHDAGEQLAVHDRHLIDENLFLAARDAGGGWLVDLDRGERQATVDRIEGLLEVVAPYARLFGAERDLERTAALAWVGEAERQRQFVAEYGVDGLAGWLSVLTNESARRVQAEAITGLTLGHAPGKALSQNGADEAAVVGGREV